MLLKRLRQDLKIKVKGIVCYSDNPQYLPFVVLHEEIQAKWAVEVFLQRDFPFINQKASDTLDQYLENL